MNMMWLKRLGAAGFVFFLIKGLLWLVIPFGIVEGCAIFVNAPQ